MKRQITFAALYEQAKAEEQARKPVLTKPQEFIARAAAATKSKESTVKLWISGYRMPDNLAIEHLASEFNCDFNALKDGFIERTNAVKRRRPSK